MLFPVTYFHPADCVLLPNSSSTQLSTFILPPPLFHMLLPASVLDAALHFLFPSSVRLLPASFRRPACYFHPTSYSHSVYCILTRPSTFCFHPPSHFPLPSSTLLRFPDFTLHAASFYILPFLDAASYFHPSCCFPHCFSLLPFTYFSPACGILFPSSKLLPRPSHTLLPVTYFHAASRFLLSPSMLLSNSCLYSASCFKLTFYTEISFSFFFKSFFPSEESVFFTVAKSHSCLLHRLQCRQCFHPC